MKKLSFVIVATVAAIIIASLAVVGYNAGTPLSDHAAASEAKKFISPRTFNSTSLQLYIEQKSADLKIMNAAEPGEVIMAAVSFKKPMTQAEIDQLVAKHRLKLDYFEYVATNNVKGVASVEAYPNLDKVQASLDHATVIGITYILAWGEVVEFEKLNRNPDVILADVGFIKEITEERAKGNVAWGNPPPNLHGWHNKLR